jgi:hypothetical protein
MLLRDVKCPPDHDKTISGLTRRRNRHVNKFPRHVNMLKRHINRPIKHVNKHSRHWYAP